MRSRFIHTLIVVVLLAFAAAAAAAPLTNYSVAVPPDATAEHLHE